MVRTEAIHGKILALAKEIHFREVPDSFIRQFFTGDSRGPWSPSPTGGIGLSWWLTRRGFRVRDELADMFIATVPDLDLNEAEVPRLIESVLQKNAANRQLFRSDAYMNGGTLFGSLAISESEFAAAILSILRETATASVTDWLFVIPLPRLRSRSVGIGFDGISIIAAGDDAAWRQVSSDFMSGHSWNSRTGHADPRDQRMMTPIETDTWLTCRQRGTANRARELAGTQVRTFIAVLFAYLHQQKTNVLIRSMASVVNRASQFSATASRLGYIVTSLGDMLPPVGDDIEISDGVVEGIIRWYERRDSADVESRRRAIIASHFVHYAIIADNLEQFVHFFVALDAMFGIRGNVENSVAKSTGIVFGGDRTWEQRARKLFECRSELLHGGASAINDWPGYRSYVKHFRSKPTAISPRWLYVLCPHFHRAQAAPNSA